MNLRQRMLCLFGVHKRSRSAAVDMGATMRSRCRGCGTPMIKTYTGWHTLAERRSSPKV